ncbi:MAG: S8 family serine peptidase [Candidatus Micrarchaeota archaeon]
MNKKAFVLFLAVLLIPMAAAEKNERYIANTNSFLDKLYFQFSGCEIMHELEDATAIKCPPGIASKFANVQEDKILHIMDMDANMQINADDVWNLGYTGTGITIAVLDTGIDTDHPELNASIAGGMGFGYSTYEDDHGHGTHVSGIITANGVTPYAKGVAPNANVWMAKVCNAAGECYTSDMAAAIEYIVQGPDGIANNGDEPADIMSISIGGGGTGGPNCNRDYLAQKVNWAVSNGATVVVAAGNSAGVVSSPACASGAIAVGAVDKNDVRAYFSGTGKSLDIMAPGVAIYSSVIGGYASWSGTSMATPHVSATIALMKEKNSTMTDAQIKEALYNTAVDLGLSSRYQGNGRLDAYAAITYTGETPPPPPNECKPHPVKCNCDGACTGNENVKFCPWDCQ